MSDSFTKEKPKEEFKRDLASDSSRINEEKTKPFNTKPDCLPHIINMR